MEGKLKHLGFLHALKGPKICDQFHCSGQLVLFTKNRFGEQAIKVLKRLDTEFQWHKSV